MGISVARTELGALRVTRWCLVITGLGLCACGPWTSDPDGFTEQDLELLQSMALPGVQPMTALRGPSAELGQKLFFDPTLAAPIATSHDGQPSPLGAVGQDKSVACADCHDPRAFFSDVRSSPNNVSLGVGWTARNSPGLTNVAQYKSWAWDGRGDTLRMQVAVAYEAKKTMAGTPLRLARALWLNPKYRAAYAAVGYTPELSADLDPTSPNASRFAPTLPDGGVGPVPDSEKAYLSAVAWNAYGAINDYILLLTSTGSAFDKFVLEGNREAMDPEARAGLKLFLSKAGCVECHKGQQFTDNEFHSLGLPQVGEHVPATDDGRYDGLNYELASPYRALDSGYAPPTDADRGAFRTKSLRNVGHTAPFMHAGQFATLDEVVRYYNSGGDHSGSAQVAGVLHPLELSEDEERQLVAFLHSLDGEPIPFELGCGDAFPDGGSRFPVCR
jgi:cytochrome c peroxidase